MDLWVIERLDGHLQTGFRLKMSSPLIILATFPFGWLKLLDFIFLKDYQWSMKHQNSLAPLQLQAAYFEFEYELTQYILREYP